MRVSCPFYHITPVPAKYLLHNLEDGEERRCCAYHLPTLVRMMQRYPASIIVEYTGDRHD